MEGHDGRHLAITVAPAVVILLASRLQSLVLMTSAYCDHHTIAKLHSKHSSTYSSLFIFVHRGKISASVRARLSSHKFHDKLRKTLIHKLMAALQTHTNTRTGTMQCLDQCIYKSNCSIKRSQKLFIPPDVLYGWTVLEGWGYTNQIWTPNRSQTERQVVTLVYSMQQYLISNHVTYHSKFRVNKIFKCFLKSILCLLRLHLFKQKYNKTLILWNIITIYAMRLLQSSVSHDPSEIILIC